MRRDHRPLWLIKAQDRLESGWAQHFLYPQFDYIGNGCHIAPPWRIRVSGSDISVGNYVHMRATKTQHIWLTTWKWDDTPPKIKIGDFCLLTPGVRISASKHIKIGRGSMIASNAYITDSDWHGTYDRTHEAGQAAPVTLGENVWVGDSAIVCKGVSIGDNSIIGAGSVVTHNIPANVIAAGAPAVPVKDLDPEVPRTTRMDLFSDPEDLAAKNEWLYGYVSQGNSLWGWIRAHLFPHKGS